MVVVLDTNIVVGNYPMTSRHFKVFFSYIRKTKGVHAVPKVVYQELRAKYADDLESSYKEYGKKCNVLDSRLHDRHVPRLDLELDTQIESYMSHYLEQMGVTQVDLLGYRAEYLDYAVSRAVERLKPCSGSGEELRDAVLWCVVKDVARENAGSPTIFISSDAKAFQDKGGSLHPDLADELQSESLDVRYFASLGAFNHEHADKVEFINDAWLDAQFPPTRILEEFHADVVRAIAAEIADSVWWSWWYPIDLQLTDASLNRLNAFVYQMDDGSTRLEVEFRGSAAFDAGVPPSSNEMSWYRSAGPQGTSLWSPTAAGENSYVNDWLWSQQSWGTSDELRAADSASMAFHEYVHDLSKSRGVRLGGMADVFLVVDARLSGESVEKYSLDGCLATVRPSQWTGAI